MPKGSRFFSFDVSYMFFLGGDYARYPGQSKLNRGRRGMGGHLQETLGTRRNPQDLPAGAFAEGNLPNSGHDHSGLGRLFGTVPGVTEPGVVSELRPGSGVIKRTIRGLYPDTRAVGV
jgi:hypothetical protein